MVTEWEFQLQLIQSAIQEGATTFSEIADKSGGLYPAELRELLSKRPIEARLKYDSRCRQLNLLSEPIDVPATYIRINPKCIMLPEPHPLDYDWRFTQKSCDDLVQIILSSSGPDSKVLLLGAPSLFVALCSVPKAPLTTLIDWNTELLAYLARQSIPTSFSLVHQNLLSGVLWQSNDKVDVVACDPPWYTEHYIAFLAQAAYACRIGAIIIVSLLPINTRPGATKDRWQILKYAHELGLHIQTIIPNSIRYTTPSFEVASLRSTGIDDEMDWRSGDTLIFRKVTDPTPEVVDQLLDLAVSNFLNVERDVWNEILLGRYKVKVRGPFEDINEVPSLISIENDDVLPTVSRRYPKRQLIDLWFWDNRVYAAKGKAAFWAALHTIADRPMPSGICPVSLTHHDLALSILLQKLEWL